MYHSFHHLFFQKLTVSSQSYQGIWYAFKYANDDDYDDNYDEDWMALKTSSRISDFTLTVNGLLSIIVDDRHCSCSFNSLTNNDNDNSIISKSDDDYHN